MRLLCNGHYPEVLVIDPLTFEVVHCLRSQVAPDWISACCLVNPSQRSGQGNFDADDRCANFMGDVFHMIHLSLMFL